MKIFLISLSLIFAAIANGQSPSLSVNLTMDKAQYKGSDFNIEMKICNLKRPTARKDLFSYEVSKVKFDALTASDVNCGEYFHDKGTEAIPGVKDQNIPGEFHFENQVFAWEDIIVFRIGYSSMTGRFAPMYVVMPVKQKSFVTQINISDLPYEGGKVVFIQNAEVVRGKSSISINASSKNNKAISRESFLLKDIL